jgi:hypothetical protein
MYGKTRTISNSWRLGSKEMAKETDNKEINECLFFVLFNNKFY